MILTLYIIEENQLGTDMWFYFTKKTIFPTIGQAFWQVKKLEIVSRETGQED